ncbi:MAG: hypothetical protein J6B39_04980, partial [Lachnospiraceae bacterium]|nr:hypothetical protein [Lachnospiraceae bacterium]
YAAERPDSVPGNLTYAERTVENTANGSYAATVTDDDFAAQTDAIVATAEGTKVTMYIWLDGDDELCVNEIMLQEILANIVLGTEDDVTATP